MSEKFKTKKEWRIVGIEPCSFYRCSKCGEVVCPSNRIGHLRKKHGIDVPTWKDCDVDWFEKLKEQSKIFNEWFGEPVQYSSEKKIQDLESQGWVLHSWNISSNDVTFWFLFYREVEEKEIIERT